MLMLKEPTKRWIVGSFNWTCDRDCALKRAHLILTARTCRGRDG